MANEDVAAKQLWLRNGSSNVIEVARWCGGRPVWTYDKPTNTESVMVEVDKDTTATEGSWILRFSDGEFKVLDARTARHIVETFAKEDENVESDSGLC